MYIYIFLQGLMNILRLSSSWDIYRKRRSPAAESAWQQYAVWKSIRTNHNSLHNEISSMQNSSSKIELIGQKLWDSINAQSNRSF